MKLILITLIALKCFAQCPQGEFWALNCTTAARYCAANYDSSHVCQTPISVTVLPNTCQTGDLVNLTAGGSPGPYICYPNNVWSFYVKQGGITTLITGSGDPNVGGVNCIAPSSTSLTYYVDQITNNRWWCYATNSWFKDLSVSNQGPFSLTGAKGAALLPPATGLLSCGFPTNNLECIDSNGVITNTVTPDVLLRSCDIVVGDQSSSNALTNTQLGPQKGLCLLPAYSIIQEIDVEADSGTPNVIPGVDHMGSISNLLSSALATASSGGRACSTVTGGTGNDGNTNCLATLQNVNVSAGDRITLVSGTSGGVAKLMSIHILYQVQ
jgi:hypothetical protein